MEGINIIVEKLQGSSKRCYVASLEELVATGMGGEKANDRRIQPVKA